jgi:hypothetical protein
MKALSVFALALLAGAAPAFANVTVVSPVNGATVTSPFALSATASPCSSQPISAMGYSLDSSSNSTIVKSTSTSASVSATAGSHVLHVKSWGASGASCVTSVSINVVQAQATNGTVSSPVNGAAVTSPFGVAASGTYCNAQPITAMGYSLDSSTNTTPVNGTSLIGQMTASVGADVVHVKSSGNGTACVTNLAVTVVAPVVPTPTPTPTPAPASSSSTSSTPGLAPTPVGPEPTPTPGPIAAPAPAGPSIPSDAVAVNNIQNLTTWKATFDTGTGSSASGSGTMSMVATPSLSGSARQFDTQYSNYGGVRYSTSLGKDPNAHNFLYDAEVYLASPINDIANIEMDMNQVLANGQTVIYAFQCAGWSKTWDYTTNAGSPTSPDVKWLHSNQTCDPQKWAPNTWHHVQISYSRDDSGNVTYQSVWLDGVEQDLNVTVPSAFALGWGQTLVTNFQIDGFTSTPGSATVYVDQLSVSRW